MKYRTMCLLLALTLVPAISMGAGTLNDEQVKAKIDRQDTIIHNLIERVWRLQDRLAATWERVDKHQDKIYALQDRHEEHDWRYVCNTLDECMYVCNVCRKVVHDD